MMDTKILSKEEILRSGHDFAGEHLDFSGSYGDQVFDFSDGESIEFSGLLYELYNDGSINYYCYYNKGVKNGKFVSFYGNGNIKRISTMVNGKMHGNTTEWYENGNLKSEANSKYSFDINYKEWDEAGALIMEVTEPNDFEKRMIEKYDKVWDKNKNE